MTESVWDWSKTAANNDDADDGINWAEGQAPGSVNNSARAMMAALAKQRDDQGGALLTGGSANAYTLTTNQGISTLADGQRVHAVIHSGNTGASTIDVDGLGAKAIRRIWPSSSGADFDIQARCLLANGHYIFEYDASLNSAAGAWVVLNPEPPPGAVVQSAFGAYTANADITGAIPYDDSIPQVGEGTQIISASITPRSTANKLRATFRGECAADALGIVAVAIFGTGSNDARGSNAVTIPGVGYQVPISCTAEWVPGSVSAQTVQVRAGVTTASKARFNGTTAGRVHGGAIAATLVIEEVAA